MRKHTWVKMLAGIALVSNGWAHHGTEFIAMEGYETPQRGEKEFYLHYDYIVPDRDNPNLDRWEVTPGLSYGITDRLLFDIHTHFAKFGADHVVEERRAEFDPQGPSPFMEAVALGLMYRLTEGWPVNLAVSGTWEIPFRRAEDLLGSEDPVYAGTLIVHRELGDHRTLCANLTYEAEGSEDEWSWAVGGRMPISADPHGISASVEIFGDFDGTWWSVMPGVYAPVNEAIILKTGIEFGQEKDDDRWVDTLRYNVTLMYRF